jgi:hypothetical protein
MSKNSISDKACISISPICVLTGFWYSHYPSTVPTEKVRKKLGLAISPNVRNAGYFKTLKNAKKQARLITSTY